VTSVRARLPVCERTGPARPGGGDEHEPLVARISTRAGRARPCIDSAHRATGDVAADPGGPRPGGGPDRTGGGA